MNSRKVVLAFEADAVTLGRDETDGRAGIVAGHLAERLLCRMQRGR